MINQIFVLFEDLGQKIAAGDFDYSPYGLAVELEALANAAWDEVDEMVADLQPSLKVD